MFTSFLCPLPSPALRFLVIHTVPGHFLLFFFSAKRDFRLLREGGRKRKLAFIKHYFHIFSIFISLRA